MKNFLITLTVLVAGFYIRPVLIGIYYQALRFSYRSKAESILNHRILLDTMKEERRLKAFEALGKL